MPCAMEPRLRLRRFRLERDSSPRFRIKAKCSFILCFIARHVEKRIFHDSKGGLKIYNFSAAMQSKGGLMVYPQRRSLSIR